MEQPSRQLTIEERPYGLWFVGAIFAGIGLIIMFQSGAPVLMGGIFFFVGGLILVYSPITTVTLDRDSNELTILSRSLIRRGARQLPLNEITRIELQSTRSSRGGSSYRIVFATRDGEKYPLTSYYSSGIRGKEQQAEQMRLFLQLEESRSFPTVKPPESEPIKTGETSGVNWQIVQGSLGDATFKRWTSQDFSFQDGFLLLAQKPAGSFNLPGGMLGGLTDLLYKQVLSAYGFNTNELPGIESADPLEPFDETLKPYFAAYTAQPNQARLLLTPWVVTYLKRWAEQYPVQSSGASGSISQLVVLFYPHGTAVTVLNPEILDEDQHLIDLGVDLVRAV